MNEVNMADLQVTCITKTQHSHEGITHLGGNNWYSTRQQVIDSIKSGTNTYYTLVDGKRADVGVVNANPPYVRTHADGKYNDNLLALGSCR